MVVGHSIVEVVGVVAAAAVAAAGVGVEVGVGVGAGACSAAVPERQASLGAGVVGVVVGGNSSMSVVACSEAMTLLMVLSEMRRRKTNGMEPKTTSTPFACDLGATGTS